MALVQLMYASTLHGELLVPAALAAMLDKARGYNLVHAITGVLVIAGPRCFQLIEGEPDEVDALYAKIALDSRHRDVSLMLRSRIAARGFGQWAMGEALTNDLALDTAGLAVRPSRDYSTASLGASHARRLLETLHRNPQWHCT